MQDTRLWHSGAANQTEHERTAVVCRYAPWWLSGAEFGNLHSGGHTLRTYVPREVYTRFSPELKLLYRRQQPRRRSDEQGGMGAQTPVTYLRDALGHFRRVFEITGMTRDFEVEATQSV
jgi:hypothetical protein